MGIDEPGLPAHQVESTVRQLTLTIAGEVVDEGTLAGDDLRTAELEGSRTKPELRGPPNRPGAIGGLDQGLTGHAATENTKPSQRIRPVDDRSLQSQLMSGTSRGIAAAPPADDHEIVIEGPGFRIRRKRCLVVHA